MKHISVSLLLAVLLLPTPAHAQKCEPFSQTRVVKCPQNFYGRIIEQNEFQCPQNRFTGWYILRNECVECIETTRTRALRCPNGQSGQITQQSKLQCPSRKSTGWYDTSNTCHHAQ